MRSAALQRIAADEVRMVRHAALERRGGWARASGRGRAVRRRGGL